MILDRLTEAARYAALHPGFAAAFDWLRTTNLAALPLGKHTLDGERLFVLVAQDEGRGHAGAKLEAHRRYIDIQYVVTGDEQIGWRATADCVQVTAPYVDDIELFGDTSETWLQMPAGTFTIFYPADAHSPLAGTGPILKAVVKVQIEW